MWDGFLLVFLYSSFSVRTRWFHIWKLIFFRYLYIFKAILLRSMIIQCFFVFFAFWLGSKSFRHMALCYNLSTKLIKPSKRLFFFPPPRTGFSAGDCICKCLCFYDKAIRQEETVKACKTALLTAWRRGFVLHELFLFVQDVFQSHMENSIFYQYGKWSESSTLLSI